MDELTLLSPMILRLEAECGGDVWQEVPVIISGQTYPIDAVARFEGFWQCVEGKKTLSESLVSQLTRLLPICNFVVGVVAEPKTQSIMHMRRLGYLRNYGVGITYVTERGSLVVKQRPVSHPIDVAYRGLLADSVVSAQQGADATPAGSAAARRAKADKWEYIRVQLRDHPEGCWARDLTFTCREDELEFKRLAPRGTIRGVVCNRQSAPYLYTLGAA